MAAGPAPKPVSDWKTVEPNDWQTVDNAQPKTPPVTGTLSAAPKPSWFEDAENDLREGGSRTIVGRTLGHMQGRGDKGYSGLESGVSKGAADFMGSPELGALHIAEGGVNAARAAKENTTYPIRAAGAYYSGKEIPKAPDIEAQGKQGPLKIGKGLLELGTLPSMFAGPVTGEAPAAFTQLLEKLPTATRGAKRLNEVEEVAGELPVNLARTSEHLMRASDMADTGASLPGPIKKLLKAFNRGDEIDYATARDFYSNLSHLSAKDNMALTPSMRRQVALIVRAMKDDIGATAEQVDKAAQYYAGMKDYARAMKAARIKNAIVGALKSKVVKTAVGAGAGYAAAKAIGKEVGIQPSNELMDGGTGDISALPAPLLRTLEGAKIVKGNPTSTYGTPDIATVDEGDSKTITVRDPSRFQPQVLGHEAKHLFDRNLAPEVRAQFPKDDPSNPYMKPQDLLNLPDMRKRGMTLKNLPEEKQAQIVQAYVQYPQMRATLQPWMDDMKAMRQSNILPTDADQKGINTTPRAPAPPSSAFETPPAPRNATDAWAGQH